MEHGQPTHQLHVEGKEEPPDSHRASRRWWSQDTVIAAAITAAATLLTAGFAAFLGDATDTFNVSVGPLPTVTHTTTVTATATPPSGGGGTGPTLSTTKNSVRRSTESTPITLKPSYGVDLDDNINPNWSVKSGPLRSSAGHGSDVGSNTYESMLDFVGDYAIVREIQGYLTCARETAYTSGGIEVGSLQQGQQICLRTDEDRYAAVTIVSATPTEILLNATVWDPPVES